MINNLFRGRLERPLTFFDLETTGVDIHIDRIVELSMLQLLPGSSEVEYTTLVNPGGAIPQAATEIHGITDDAVKDAPHFRDIADTILEYLRGSDIAGYNVRKFDIPMLQEEFRRCGKNWAFDLEETAIVDGCDIFFKMEPRSLEGALKFYCGKEHLNAHGAHADVLATIEVIGAQIARYGLGDTPREVFDKVRDPDAVDLAGKLRWVGPDICINFGKYVGVPLRKLPLDYLQWMLNQHVIGRDAEHIIHNGLNRQYLTREVSNNEEKNDGK